MGLNNTSAACKESDPQYVGIVISTLRDYFENYIHEEQVAGSQYMVAIVYIIMDSRTWKKEKEKWRMGGRACQRREGGRVIAHGPVHHRFLLVRRNLPT